MEKRPIPFPHLDPATEPEPIVKHCREIVIRLGSERYAIDITTSARPLPPEPAKGQGASHETPQPALGFRRAPPLSDWNSPRCATGRQPL
jgi:hypothetical protein